MVVLHSEYNNKPITWKETAPSSGEFVELYHQEYIDKLLTAQEVDVNLQISHNT